jgi:WD40 repeat protein
MHSLWGVTAIQFSPDDRMLLTTSGDGNGRLWRLRPEPKPDAFLKLSASIAYVTGHEFNQQLGRSPGSIATTLQDGTVRVISDELRELERFASEDPAMVVQLPTRAWQENMWAVWEYERDKRNPRAGFLWRKDGAEIRRFDLVHPAPVTRDTFTYDDRYLITCSIDARLRFWRTSDGQLERTIDVPPYEQGEGGLGDLSPDGRTALWGTLNFSADHLRDGLQPLSVRFLDLETGELIGEPLQAPGHLSGHAFWSPGGREVALRDPFGSLTVLESRTGRVISSSIAHSSSPNWVQWHPAGRRLLTAGEDDQVLVWDAETGTQLLSVLRTPGAIVRIARWSPDGRFIVTQNDKKQIRVWDAATGEAVTPAIQQSGQILFAIMTRSNRVLAATFPDLISAWDLKETLLPAELLTDYAKLLAGRELRSGGVVRAIPPKQLAELNRSLRALAPQLFQ